ncbi:polysaccharide pyruvyl transferase family protein [Qipengyuania sp. 1NDH17]|uniref:Polysaccharide pyruvyl transferase family protein n=1 Tax=Qipengyuania polymorpha TaxID=2867234 RepID=A0ABS7IZ05_9SPHN|nr:polysaccharide pyruvyl transferase family protein [Qipengyuania polymorpha]MBX7457692.1 polysaccharide pyruvyl transferase family protein [Qipengyuania polymorpha]
MSNIRSATVLARKALARIASPGCRTGYIGFVGHDNLGDEAMYEAAHALLGPRVETLSTPGGERLLARTPLGGTARFELAFLGGGTLVNANYIDIAEQCLDLGIPLATLGTGVGSAGFSGSEGELDPRWARALSRFERVGVRGPHSLAQLHRAGVDKAEIIGDLALALTPDAQDCDPNSKTLLFNTSVGRTSEDKARLAAFDTAMASELARLAAAGWTIVPLAFHSDDLEPIGKVLAAAGLGGTAIQCPPTFEAYRQFARRACLSVSVRLHGSVLASMCGLPNLLLEYRRKCRDFCASIEAEDNLLGYADFSSEELRSKLDGAISAPEAKGRALHEACLGYRARLRSYAAGLSRG